jgi:hypothetical protein
MDTFQQLSPAFTVRLYDDVWSYPRNHEQSRRPATRFTPEALVALKWRERTILGLHIFSEQYEAFSFIPIHNFYPRTQTHVMVPIPGYSG